MSTTRQKILEHLDRYQPASLREIGRALSLSDADILYHIQALLEEDKIELVERPADAPLRRGRPVKRYRVKNPTRPDNYALLAQILLLAYLDHLEGQTEKDAALLDLSHRLLPAPDTELSINARLTRLVRQLSDRKYAARWEARASGPQVIFANCPYLKVAAACPKLCRLDQLILQNYLSVPVTLVQRIIDEDKSNPHCRFAVEVKILRVATSVAQE